MTLITAKACLKGFDIYYDAVMLVVFFSKSREPMLQIYIRVFQLAFWTIVRGHMLSNIPGTAPRGLFLFETWLWIHLPAALFPSNNNFRDSHPQLWRQLFWPGNSGYSKCAPQLCRIIRYKNQRWDNRISIVHGINGLCIDN